MPELPEVETIRRGLASRIINKKISRVFIIKKTSIKGGTAEWQKVLAGNSFKSAERIGKLLVFRLAKGGFMLAHLKMTGQLIFCFKQGVIAGGHSDQPKSGESAKIISCQPGPHTRVYFDFSDGSRLVFNDLRRFGYLKLVDRDELLKIKRGYGLEPFSPEFNVKNLAEIFKKRKASVKAVLLDQKAIAGIGNIYADEILFAARINPRRRADQLTQDEIKKIHRSARRILKKAISERGTTFNNYKDSIGQSGGYLKRLKVYGRANKLCLVCRRSPIKKIKLAGRGTHFCPLCQKSPF